MVLLFLIKNHGIYWSFWEQMNSLLRIANNKEVDKSSNLRNSMFSVLFLTAVWVNIQGILENTVQNLIKNPVNIRQVKSIAFIMWDMNGI